MPYGSLHVLLVALDHFLERVSRTTSEILEILVCGLSGKDLDLQPHGAVCFWGNKNLVNILIHKVLIDDSLRGIPPGIVQNTADGVDVFPKFISGKLLLFQLVNLPFSLADLLIALFVHGEEVPIGELPGGVVAQQLAFLFVRQVCLVTQGGNLSLEASWQDARFSAAVEETDGAQSSQISAAANDMAFSATGLRTDEIAQWRAILTGDDGTDAFRLEALYDAQIAPLEGGGTREVGTFSLNAEEFSAAFALEASTVPVEGAAGFLDGMDMPVIRMDELTEAEQMALAARMQSLVLNFAAGAIQNVPGLTDFATMLASPLGDSLSAQGVLDALAEVEEQGFEGILPNF